MINYSLDVVIIDDRTLENNESFTLTIEPSSLPMSVTPDDIAQAKMIIVDNDGE